MIHDQKVRQILKFHALLTERKKDGKTLISVRGWWCVYARKLLLHVSVDEQGVQSLKYCHLHTFKKPQYFESNARDISKV